MEGKIKSDNTKEKKRDKENKQLLETEEMPTFEIGKRTYNSGSQDPDKMDMYMKQTMGKIFGYLGKRKCHAQY